MQDSDIRLEAGSKRVDIGWIHKELSEKSYWAKGRTLDQMKILVEDSYCFGAYRGTDQIGFARVVSDGITIAYLADVWIAEGERGTGIGGRLVSYVVTHPDLAGVKRWVLVTQDAQEFYRGHGFSDLTYPERYMERVKPADSRTEA